MNADEAVAFLEQIGDRAYIAPLAKFFALSRSHLFFLPPKDRLQSPSEPAGRQDFANPEKVRERRFRLDQQERLNPADAKWYARAVQSLLKAPFIVDGAPQAVNEISRTETFFSIERLNDCKRMPQEAAELLSCAWAPISFKFGSASGLHFAGLADVGRMVSDTGHPFRDFLKTDTLQAIGAAEAVGISITYRNRNRRIPALQYPLPRG